MLNLGFALLVEGQPHDVVDRVLTELARTPEERQRAEQEERMAAILAMGAEVVFT